MPGLLKGGLVFPLSRKRRACRTVHQDWHAELTAEKLKVFVYVLGEVNPAHVIYSMALDEAIALRKSGRFELAREQANVSGELCGRFAGALEALLRALLRHAQYFGTLPAISPLNPEFFTGKTARKAASTNSLLSNVLFTQNSRFMHKIWTLGEMASDIGEEYRTAAADVAEGSRASMREDWEQLSSLQFDLTTSLRETTIVLKSFLISLPKEEVASFRDRLVVSLSDASAVLDRRAAALRRQ
jgi:hypothetical protein